MIDDQKLFVLQACRDQDIKFIRLWFTDILGSLKSLAVTVEELEEALEEGQLRRLAASRASRGVDETDMLAMPDPTTFQLLPWRPRRAAASRAMFCDIQHAGRLAVRGRPALGAASASSSAPPSSATPSTSGRSWSSSTSRSRSGAGGARRGRLLRPDAARRGQRPAPRDGAHARGDGHRRRVQPPRSCAEPARDRPALHGRADHGRQHDDVPPGGEGGRAERTASTPPSCRSRCRTRTAPACTCTSRCSRASRNAFFDADDQTTSRRSPGYIAGLLRHAQEITLVTNQWVNSYKRLIPGYEAPVYITWARRTAPT